MKLYTRRGDQGQTDLFGGQRVEKDDPRVAAYGDVDELNSVLGWARTACGADHPLSGPLEQVQNRLFDVGADLATPYDPANAMSAKVRRITAADVTSLEAMVDTASGEAPAMKSFILPGGCEAASRLHLARTVCRRAERSCLALVRVAPEHQQVLHFLNRLSDLLFAMARQANHHAGIDDVPWTGQR